MPDTTIEPTYEAEPIVAVESKCVNDVYKIKYIHTVITTDDDDDGGGREKGHTARRQHNNVTK